MNRWRTSTSPWWVLNRRMKPPTDILCKLLGAELTDEAGGLKPLRSSGQLHPAAACLLWLPWCVGTYMVHLGLTGLPAAHAHAASHRSTLCIVSTCMLVGALAGFWLACSACQPGLDSGRVAGLTQELAIPDACRWSLQKGLCAASQKQQPGAAARQPGRAQVRSCGGRSLAQQPFDLRPTAGCDTRRREIVALQPSLED